MSYDLAVTGHRNLGRSVDFVRREVRRILDGLAPEIRHVLVGGALGFDTIVMEHCVEREYPFHVFAIDGQAAKWGKAARDHYGELLQSKSCRYLTIKVSRAVTTATFRSHVSYAESVYGVLHGHEKRYADAAHLLIRRNEEMVLRPEARAGLACWDGRKTGGTFRMMGYARRNKPLMQWHRIDPREAV